jgi:sterol desaturase/sphingolipid hydroxylase (fatty acid hydroxylase superfamily)|tara:strand:+ start:43 stop:225 length:183 start_codon:yes stop_codon:yes gene_type:complete
MSIFSKFWDKVTGTEKVKVRSRNKKGHYVADDKSTPNVNEAYTTKRVKKKKAKITTQNIG